MEIRSDTVVFRWVRAASSGVAHLDSGERLTESPRVRGTDVIVSVCQAHLVTGAEVVPEIYQPRCSNCQRLALRR